MPRQLGGQVNITLYRRLFHSIVNSEGNAKVIPFAFSQSHRVRFTSLLNVDFICYFKADKINNLMKGKFLVYFFFIVGKLVFN